MNLTLVNPVTKNKVRVLRVERCQQKVLSPVGIWPPITLLEIAAKLKIKGLSNIAVIDGEADGLSFDELIDRVILGSPDLAIMQSSTPTVDDDLTFSSLLKNKLPFLKTVFIGLPATTLTEWLLKYESVDFAILGEPQDTVCDLIDYLDGGKIKLSEILGLGYKCEGQVLINKRRPAKDNYDYAVFPDRGLLDNENYRLSLNNKKFTVIKTSRGCDFACSFCTSGVYYGRGWRARSTGNIIQEIKEVKHKQGIDSFLFLSDTFNGSKEFVKDLTTKIISEDIDIQWVANSRLDLVDEENVSLMKKSGCVLVSLGIETFEEDILKINKKFLKLENIYSGLDLFKKYGILTFGYFIFGLEGETRKSIWRTIYTAASSKLDFAVFYSLTPFPGTEYFKIYNSKNWSAYFHGISSIVTYKHLSGLEIKIYRYAALFLFYIRPRRLKLLARFFFRRKLL